MIDLSIEQWQHLDQRWKSFKGGLSIPQLRSLIRSLQDILPAGCPEHKPPDPSTPSTPLRVKDKAEGGIVELFHDYFKVLSLHGSCTTQADAALNAIGRAIEAEIKAVRNLFRNHEERIKALDTSTPEKTSLVDLVHISSKESLEMACKVDSLERKVESMEKDNKTQARETFEFRRTEFEIIRRKIEQTGGLEDRVRALQNRVYRLEDHEDWKPQPSVAQAWDKDHKEKHDLIPGVSVLKGKDPEGVGIYFYRIFHHAKGDSLCCYPIFKRGNIGDNVWETDKERLVWIRDLSFPATGTTGRGNDLERD